ncbi:hypothetical protein LRS11_16225 [Pseudomonas sp. J452]|jgi:hypothetical protein|uniref:hypothetical protein n=1 Tax=Pseudomonas sp. J452 TaxID=2898441 RepID=UPI0021AD97C8|nr:hypothetical protein [Pseudomonas sp. J452]UUY07360.1 hypothetical protein LRS11_16225 [Pseudomonas sp. J452]
MDDFEEYPSREEFLDLLWREIINSPMQEEWIENSIDASQEEPNGPFGDVGPALKRLLSLGASRRDLSLLYRMASYEAVFSTLYKMDDPGIDPNEAAMLFEDLLMSDPSGLEAGPGSAPVKNA